MKLTPGVRGPMVAILPHLTNQLDVPPYFEGELACYFAGRTLLLGPRDRRVMTELVRGAPWPVKVRGRTRRSLIASGFLIQAALRGAKVPWHVKRFRGYPMIMALEPDGNRVNG